MKDPKIEKETVEVTNAWIQTVAARRAAEAARPTPTIFQVQQATVSATTRPVSFLPGNLISEGARRAVAADPSSSPAPQ